MSPIELSEDALTFLDRHLIGHLATSDRHGEPHVVPLCYARVQQQLYFVCDEKPKRNGPRALKRLANLRENPRAALVVDDYGDDWRRLAFLLLHLDGEVVDDSAEWEIALRALRQRYPQYRDMELSATENPIVRLVPTSAHYWQAAADH